MEVKTIGDKNENLYKSEIYCPLSSNHRGKPLDSPPSPKEKARIIIKKVTFYLFSDNKRDLFLFCVFLQPLFLWSYLPKLVRSETITLLNYSQAIFRFVTE